MGGCVSRDGGAKIWKARFPDVDIPDKTLHRLMFDKFDGGFCGNILDKVAYVDGISGEEWTCGKLLDAAKSVAAGLTAAGLSQGDVVAVYLPNTPIYFSIVYGALLAGVAATLISPSYQDFELENAMKITEPKVWFTLASFASSVAGASEKIGAKQTVVVVDTEIPEGTTSFTDFVKPDGAFTEATDTNAIALLCYSSGTTGLPKAVALTHKNVVANLKQLTSQPDHFLGFDDNTVLLAVLPFFHIYGVMVFLIAAPYTGPCTVTMPKFDPEKYIENLKKYKVTVAHVAPPIVQFLLKHPMVAKAMPFDDLKEVFCAAAPLAPEPANELKAKLNLDVIRQGYGMTELSPVLAFGDKLNAKPGSVGLLVPNQEMKLIGDDGKPVSERNQRGEVLIRGPNVMKGYYKNQEATDGCIDPEGFLHTGDVAYLDDDDQLWIVDRTKELIKVKGFQVAPAELEGHLLSHPKIGDAAVIGVAAGFDYGGREGDGQLPKAFIVKKDESLTEDEVKEFISKDLVEYKWLAAVEFIDAIPKSASGKILRKDLRKREEDAGKKVFA